MPRMRQTKPFASVCRSSKRMNMVDFEQETTEQIKENESQDKNVDELKVFSLNSGNANEVFAQLKIIDEEQSLSSTLVLNWTEVHKLMQSRNIFLIEFRNVKLKPINILLTAFGGSNVRPIGKCNLTCVYKNV